MFRFSMTRCSILFTSSYIWGPRKTLLSNLPPSTRQFSSARMTTSELQSCSNANGEMVNNEARKQKRLSVKLGTFNILAPCYNVIKSIERKTFWGGKKESSFPDVFLARYEQIFKVFESLPEFDFMCLQEFWFNNDVAELFENKLGNRYFIYKHKRPTRHDGVALLIGKEHRVLHTEYIKFHDIGMRVALLSHVVISGTEQELILVTTHLTYLASYVDQYKRMSQAKKLAHVIDSYITSIGGKNIPVLLSGDFNGRPDGPIYQYFTDLGFISAYKSFHGYDPQITHVDHNGSLMPADYIFYRMPAEIECTVLDAFLVPKDCSDKEWPTEFVASDHRPVFAEISLCQR